MAHILGSLLMKIIIVGAGAAGLAAANELAKHHVDVTILEADDRAGGRMCTDYSLGVPIDRGAAWLHGTQNNPIADLAKKLQLRTALTEFNNYLFFDEDKSTISPQDIEKFSQLFDQLSHDAKKFAESLPNDISFLDAMNAVKPKNLSPKLKNPWNWCLRRMSLISGGSVSDLSARHWDEEEVLEGGHHIMLDGYSEIAKKLSEHCPILFNQTVKKIQYNKSGVEVTTQNEIFHCDKIIITVSLGVLKKQLIEFHPNLPAKKLKAIQHLNMGVLNKVVLKFPKQFWPSEPIGIYLSGNTTTHFLNYTRFCQQPILGLHVGGDEAADLEKFSDEKLIDMTMSQLKKYFGNDIPDPEKYFITRWASNPFTYGSYAYIPVNATGDDYDDLAEPVSNQLFFAGEATFRKHLATVHGAYLSGIREANRVLF
jgi:monoamine oxidase